MALGSAPGPAVRVYLDSNVIDHVDKGYIPVAEVEAFKDAGRRGLIVAPISIANIEEILGQWEQDREGAIRQLRLARELIRGFHGLLKQPAEILREAFEGYANNTAPASVAVPGNEQMRFLFRLSDVLAGSRRFDNEVRAVIAEVRTLKERWFASMSEAQRQALGELGWGRAERARVNFEEYFNEAARGWAESLAEPLGLAEACRRRGLEGLIEVPAVRLCVGTVLSHIVAQTAGTPPHHDVRTPNRGDGYDVWHAILASTAHVFVTRDERLAAHVAGIPARSVRVVTSLREALP